MRISPFMPGRTRHGSPARLLIRTHSVSAAAAFGGDEEGAFGPQIAELDVFPSGGKRRENADGPRLVLAPDRSNSGGACPG